MSRPPKSYLKDSHPELAQQLVDKSLLGALATGSDKSVEWECPDCGYRWFAKPYNRTNAKNPTGCPVCAGKAIVEGVNDLASVRPDLVQYFVNKNLASQVTLGSNKKIMVVCAEGHTRQLTPAKLVQQGISCPWCSHRYSRVGEDDLATTHSELVRELVDKSKGVVYQSGTEKKVEWECSVCGHHWFATVASRANRGTGCPRCSGRIVTQGVNDLATIAPEYAKTLVDPALGVTIGQYSSKKVEWRCQQNAQHTWFSTPGNRLKSPVEKGCPICNGKVIVPGYNDIATTHPELAKELVDTSLATKISAGSGRKVEWQCSKGHRWIIEPFHRTGKNGTGCPVCNPTGTSKMEQEVADVVKRLLWDERVDTNVKNLLPGRLELDIVVPGRKTAFEFNGVRWHSEDMGKGRTYHKDKVDACAQAGYRLVHIWEDEWRAVREVVIRLIAAKLGVTSRLREVFPEIDERASERLFARKLVPREILKQDAYTFLDVNHIQGRVTVSRAFGLYDSNGCLRAVLGIRSPRNNARMHRGEGEWEIQRYATFGTIVGGFSKLMKYAEHMLLQEGVTLRRWISFSSNDVSDGAMYEKCGFVRDGELKPDYKYVGEKIGWYRHPKEAFQRKTFRDRDDMLWDESWTEREAAEKNGLYRVYDSGKIRWVKDVVL